VEGYQHHLNSSESLNIEQHLCEECYNRDHEKIVCEKCGLELMRKELPGHMLGYHTEL
jgi:hypothetical protein